MDKGYEVDPEDVPALFVSLKHQRLTVSSAEKMLKSYKSKAGISKKNHTTHRKTHLRDKSIWKIGRYLSYCIRFRTQFNTDNSRTLRKAIGRC